MKNTIVSIINKRWTLPAISVVGGFAAGTATGMFIRRKQFIRIENALTGEHHEFEAFKASQLELDFERAEKDREFNVAIEEAALVTRKLAQEGNRLVETVRDIRPPVTDEMCEESKALHPSNQKPNRGVPLVSVRTEETFEPVIKSVFDNAGDEWDYEIELGNRTSDMPYVIHVDEYVGDEMGWDSQSTLTYYEKDDILCDSKDMPLYNHQALVGELLFGHGSNDANVVYIRNEILQAEYEILRDEGAYEDIVGGVEHVYNERDLRHMQSPRKFRED